MRRIPVNPDVILWARETAGLDIEEAASRVGVRPGRVQDWESGRIAPTINQLRAMSKAYFRPLAALFMPEPIDDEPSPVLPDFRRRESRDSGLPHELQQAIVRVYRQRDSLLEIAQVLDVPTVESVASFRFRSDINPDAVGAQLRDLLQMGSIGPRVFEQPDELLRVLVMRTERLNVTITQVQHIPVEIMRGFSVADGPWPFIALNSADWSRGKIFTLLHELTHIGVRTSGLCDLARLDDNGLERFCDRVAASALMPRENLEPIISAKLNEPLSAQSAQSIGMAFGASGESVVLRMIDMDYARWDDYWRLKPEFTAAYSRHREESILREQRKDLPIYYQLKVRDLGRRYIRIVLGAFKENAISSRDVAQMLELNFSKISRLVRTLGAEGS